MEDSSYIHIPEKKAFSPVRFAFSAIGLLSIVLLEPLYGKSLFESSLTFIKQVQDDMSTASETAWIVYTDTIALVMTLPILVSLLQFKERVRALYYVIMLTAMLFTMNISKLCYHQPRPFWVSP